MAWLCVTARFSHSTLVSAMGGKRTVSANQKRPGITGPLVTEAGGVLLSLCQPKN